MLKLAAPKRAAFLGLAAAAFASIGLAGVFAPKAAQASSHSDAPLIKLDPQANLTDVYAFVGTKFGDPSTKVLNVIVSVHPVLRTR